jgi:hypothetical protein
MKRLAVALGILGLVWAAAKPAGAQAEMTLFGKKYSVVVQSRAQTYKTADGKEVKIVLADPETYTQKAGLYFAEGADPSKDRLFVVANTDADDEGVVWHQAYMLTGADANGVFTPASATLTEFFGGAGDRFAGGRPWSILLINEENTGVKMDRNVLMQQWTGDNGYRLYDLDSMNAKNHQTDELYFRPTGVLGGTTEERYLDIVVDDNAPHGDIQFYAPAPSNDGRTIVGIGASDAGGTEVGVWDTKTDAYFPIVTNLTEKTADAVTPIPDVGEPNAIIRHAGNEYWIIISDPRPSGFGVELSTQDLYRVRLTLPANPAGGNPGDIGVEVLGKESLLGTPVQTSPGGVLGMAVGREAATGLRRLYFATLDGQIVIATPQP